MSGILTSCRNYGTVSGTSSFNDIYGSPHSSGTPTLIDCGVENKFFISDGSVSDPADYDYSFAIIGDHQCMVQYAKEMNSDKYFKLIYDYVIGNAESKKSNTKIYEKNQRGNPKVQIIFLCWIFIF